jgi:hypothetical protein
MINRSENLIINDIIMEIYDYGNHIFDQGLNKIH